MERAGAGFRDGGCHERVCVSRPRGLRARGERSARFVGTDCGRAVVESCLRGNEMRGAMDGRVSLHGGRGLRTHGGSAGAAERGTRNVYAYSDIL
jgi:hypothetical protein